MFRTFNLLKSKFNVVKKNDGLIDIGVIIKNCQDLKNNNSNNRINVMKCFFSTDKSEIQNEGSRVTQQHPIIKQVIETQVKEKNTKTKSSNKNLLMPDDDVKKQNNTLETFNNKNLSYEEQIKQQEKEKNPRKKSKKTKKQQLKVSEQSEGMKISQTDFLSQKKTKSFYKILFPESQYERQQQKLLEMLQKSHQKSINQQSQNSNIKVQKKQKKKKKQPKEIRPLFEQKTNNLQLKGLDDLLQQANKDIQFPKIEQFEESFFNVLKGKRRTKFLVPFGFRYHLYRYCKYQVYLSQSYSKDEMMKYQIKFIDTIRFYCLGKMEDLEKKISHDLEIQGVPNSQKDVTLQQKKQLQTQSQLIDRLPYVQLFMTNLLPFQNTQTFADLYLEIGLEYTKLLKERLAQSDRHPQLIIPSVNSLRMILTNMKRLLFNNCEDFQLDDAKEQDYLLYRTFFNQYLDFFCVRKYKFETADKVECIEIAKFLKIPHPEFMQFVKQFVQDNLQNFSMVEFLLMLGYLVQNKNTPYEYFYKHKGNWMKIIQSSHDFSTKKTRACIKLLQVFSRQRFLNCQKIYHRLLQIITNNLQAMEGKQLVRTLYYYSRTRYATNPIFISNLVDKISRWLPYLQERQFSLLVRSIGNLNYQSAQLVEKLKNINYERFLCELKYGCENLGLYYQEILKQVQTQSRGKQYFDGQEIFHSSNEISNENQEDFLVAAEKIF